MPKTVLIVVGHKNIPGITKEGLRSWRDVNALKASTGGNGEAVFNWDQVMPKLRDALILAGVQVFVTDAVYHAETYSREYDAAIVLHDDGGGNENRSMSSAPLRTTPPYLNSPAQAESERFATLWNTVYPQLTGTIFRSERITAGMRENYAFDYIGFDTPVILVEHFNRDSQKGQELRQNPALVAQADANVVLQFLGLPTSNNGSNPAIGELEKQIADLKNQVNEKQGKIETLTAQIADLQVKINKARSALE